MIRFVHVEHDPSPLAGGHKVPHLAQHLSRPYRVFVRVAVTFMKMIVALQSGFDCRATVYYIQWLNKRYISGTTRGRR